MRVWVYPEKKYEDLGAERWEASWEEVRKESEGKDDIDPDSDLIYRVAAFKTKEAAVKYATKLIDGFKTAFGCVTVTRQIVDWFVEEDRVAEWTDTNDREEVTS